MKTWTLDVKEDPDSGEAILEFPPDMLEKTGWKEGDTLVWTDHKNGSFTLTKKEATQWVLVETVSSFRHRYMIEVPVGIDNYGQDKVSWALDTVTMEKAKEFSQQHIGEQIVSHRVIPFDDALALCDTDNNHCTKWDTEVKLKNYFTTWEEQNDGTN